MNPLVHIENLGFTYDKNTIIEDMCFDVPAGSFLAIAGPNGAGKTTLLNLICGILKPQSGQVTIDSVPIKNYSSKNLARKIAVVRQEFVPSFDFTVRETVSMARTPYMGILGFESDEDKDIVAQALEITETMHLASRPLGQISSGERQRVFIARALAQSTPVILLDEPTSFLDIRHQVEIYDLLKKAQLENNKTIIAITHDINLTMQYSEKTLLLCPDKKYHIGATSEVLTKDRIEQAFGVRTLKAEIGSRSIIMPVGKFFNPTN